MNSKINDQALPLRFWEKIQVSPETGCWLWTGGKTLKGYASFYFEGRVQLAHRVSYRVLSGPIPDGKQLDHVKARGCLHRHCVNPLHLEPVTSSENNYRSSLPEITRLRHAAKRQQRPGSNMESPDKKMVVP